MVPKRRELYIHASALEQTRDLCFGYRRSIVKRPPTLRGRRLAEGRAVRQQVNGRPEDEVGDGRASALHHLLGLFHEKDRGDLEGCRDKGLASLL
jgi:hypothetical protein